MFTLKLLVQSSTFKQPFFIAQTSLFVTGITLKEKSFWGKKAYLFFILDWLARQLGLSRQSVSWESNQGFVMISQILMVSLFLSQNPYTASRKSYCCQYLVGL